MKKYVVLALILLVLTGAGLTFAFQREIGERIFAGVAAQRMTDNRLVFGDGLHLVLCGTGSPLPNLDRAGPCNLVVAGDQAFVIDIGEGGARNLNLMRFDLTSVDALLLTHFHSDHTDGLGPLALLYWSQGVEQIAEGYNITYAQDHSYRIEHHGTDLIPPSGRGIEAFPFAIADGPVVVREEDGLTITAIRVDHDPVKPAVAYRFDYRGRSIVIGGDADKSESLATLSKGADILVHDALQPKLVAYLTDGLSRTGRDNVAEITVDILDYHASPEEAAETAQAAGVRHLVLSHLVPPIPNSFLYPAFLGDAPDRFDGEITVGEDGMVFSLPPESEAVERDRAM